MLFLFLLGFLGSDVEKGARKLSWRVGVQGWGGLEFISDFRLLDHEFGEISEFRLSSEFEEFLGFRVWVLEV